VKNIYILTKELVNKGHLFGNTYKYSQSTAVKFGIES